MAQSGLKTWREGRGWTQAELARLAGISRSAVSAIEMGQLVPSVASALSLAAALGGTVEEIFGNAPQFPQAAPSWAWPAPSSSCRYWQATVRGRSWLYPAEATAAGQVAHDGVCRDGILAARGRPAPDATLLMASCDPAAGLLAAEITRTSNLRTIVFRRSSHEALALLDQGLVHAAGVHLATRRSPASNAAAARQRVERECRLLRVAAWQEGVCLAAGSGIASLGAVVRGRLRWVGREAGSGAGQCLNELLEDRRKPRQMARDHQGVADAVRAGWADAGVCLRLVSEEAGLAFLPVREEIYDLCFLAESESDFRIRALVAAVRSPGYRRLLGDLPGFDPADCGAIDPVKRR